MSDGPEINTDEREHGPSVLMLVAGEKRHIKHKTWGNVDFRFQADGEYKNAPAFFNAFLEQAASYDIVAFMNEGSNFSSENSLAEIVEELSSKPIHGGVYTDTKVLDEEGNLVFYQIHPSYDPRLVHGKFAVNGPLFIKSQILEPFDESMSVLYMWDKYIGYCNNTLMYHIAEPIVTVPQNTDDPKLVSQEFKMINEKIKEK